MSWSGLNSGLYEQIREYAELTDQTLVELKAEASHLSRDSRERLGQLLLNIDSSRRKDLSARLIWFILRDSVKMSDQEITRLGAALLKTTHDESVVRLLEKLAQALAHEQVVVKSRMRSGVR